MHLLLEIRNWFEGTYTLRIIDNSYDLFLNLGPFLLISIALNVAAVQYFKYRKINFSSRSEIVSILLAALIGLVSPLPTYAAIPIGMSLMAVGVPFSAMIAFVISSPLMNPSIFFLTVTQIGWEMAIIRTGVAFLVAVTGGLLTIKLFRSINTIQPCKVDTQSKPTRSVWMELFRNSIYVSKTFSIAILISAAVKALISPQLVERMLGGDANSSTLAAIALGIPFYTCGGAAIPFIDTLMQMGMNKGAVLAFFISGPATKAETFYAYNKLLGKKVLLFYLSLTLSFSYLAGIVYSMF
jgi:uncharacterized membrane protein YraQ (UPF0718 family)